MSKKKVFVISDLHLGGDKGFQMCSNQTNLARFILWVTKQKKDNQGVDFNLVLAGDIIDFLAEGPWDSFTHSEEEALKKLENVFKNFRSVWRALRCYVKSGANLTILLGNHDVEMSLPKVRRRLLKELGRGGSIEFIYDNEAFVLGEDVIIEHGNRYDSWNVVNHDSLRQIRSLMSRKQVLGDIRLETPGSVFVSEVMNDLKSKYAFIDLLKPQNLAVALLLSALEPDKIFSLEESSAGRKNILLEGLLKAVSLVKPVVLGEVINKSGGEDHFPKRRELMSGELKKATEKERFENLMVELGFDPQSVSDLKKTGQTSGTSKYWGNYNFPRVKAFCASISAVFAGEDEEKKINRIYKAFKHLAEVKSFDEDNIYAEAAKTLAKDFKLVVFGHTHHAMKKQFDFDGREPSHYINSGTWADIISISEELLKGDIPCDEFKQFVDDLKNNNINKHRGSKGSFVEIELDEDDRLVSADVFYYLGKDSPKMPFSSNGN